MIYNNHSNFTPFELMAIRVDGIIGPLRPAESTGWGLGAGGDGSHHVHPPRRLAELLLDFPDNLNALTDGVQLAFEPLGFLSQAR
jgi:hypothetical protein